MILRRSVLDTREGYGPSVSGVGVGPHAIRKRPRALAAALLVAANCTALDAQSRPGARLFAPQDLGLLEPPDRAEWQKPEQIMDALGIADGSVVADLGAGGGWFTIRLARRVGPNGTVYAEDIQPQMIDMIQRRVQRENLGNVRTILGTANDPQLPAGLDAVLIVGAYREMEIPPADPVSILRRVAQSLKPQGRLGIVDFVQGGGGPGPAAQERVDPDAVVRAASTAGLRRVAREQVSAFQYLLVFDRGR